MTDDARPLNREEEEVRARLEFILEVPVERLDFNSGSSVADLKIIYPDRSWAPVEVTTAIDEQDAAALNSDWFDGWEAPRLTNSWLLGTFGPPPHLTRLRRRRAVENQLYYLEQAGIDSFTTSERLIYQVRAADSHADPELGIWRALNTLMALNIEHGRIGPTPAGASGAYLNFALGRGGVRGPSAEPVTPWASEFVGDEKRADNLRKLDRGGGESHLAVQVTLSGAGIAVWDGIGDSDRIGHVPSTDPELPETLTDLWLAVSFAHGDVLHWKRGRGWLRYIASNSESDDKTQEP